MVIIVFSAAVWLFLGWKLGLAIVVGAILESIEVVVMLRAVSRLRREKAELINFLNDAAIHLETAVQEVGSCLENNSLVNP
jgi:membrane protein implicated in regulation of membrane protease activity